MPVKFEIYRDGQRLSQFQPTAAYAVGPESVPIQADIIPRDGTLIVSRPDDVPVGLSLLWEAGPAGEYELETTRLQPRERPYILNVELARLTRRELGHRHPAPARRRERVGPRRLAPVVRESSDVVAATKLLENGQSETIRIGPNAIREEGLYEYVCTFPGHWMVMNGQMIVE